MRCTTHLAMKQCLSTSAEGFRGHTATVSVMITPAYSQMKEPARMADWHRTPQPRFDPVWKTSRGRVMPSVTFLFILQAFAVQLGPHCIRRNYGHHHSHFSHCRSNDILIIKLILFLHSHTTYHEIACHNTITIINIALLKSTCSTKTQVGNEKKLSDKPGS